MTTIKFNIRKVTKEDSNELFRLIKELADYEKQSSSVTNDTKNFEKDSFSSKVQPYECFVVEDPSYDGTKTKLIAYAMYCIIYCSKAGKRIDFRDIYVSSKYRSYGVGKQLLSAVCKEAVKENVRKLNLMALKWNPAISFYKKLGFINVTETEGYQCYLMKENDIKRVADSVRSGNKFRKATKDDCGEIFRLIMELAIHEKTPNAVEVNEEILRRDGFETENPPFMCLVMDDPDSNRKLLAYSLFSRTYSSYDGKRFFLGDIFISASCRGQGLGKKMMAAVCKEALKENVKTIRFNVLKDNPSVEFYNKLVIENITETEEWQYLKLNSEGIVKTAGLC
ncbi:uncharacterized protein [Halyomorpha halys]|uniref:uncharacterized protein n=1 Tax=Halyomorpha halys TaxID=286706 RepID=UPI0006D4E7D3|nr:uncharacterized protein LOC106677435 [Halyomorpha halys]